MLEAAYNELRLDYVITPVSPLSIQGAGSSHFVRAMHPFVGDQSVYIPASTFKGTLRHIAEQVTHSANLECCDQAAPCDPDSGVLCSVCRLFGNRTLRSHLTVGDAFPLDPLDPRDNPIQRQNDRQQRPITTETIVGESFYGSLSLRNFERWQVGLLALIMARLNLADIQIGANRGLGMGQISVQFRGVSLLYFGMERSPAQHEAFRTRLHGAGQLAGPNKGYTYPDVANIPDLPDLAAIDLGLGYTAVLILSDDETEAHGVIDNMLTTQAVAWGGYVRTHRTAK